MNGNVIPFTPAKPKDIVFEKNGKPILYTEYDSDLGKELRRLLSNNLNYNIVKACRYESLELFKITRV